MKTPLSVQILTKDNERTIESCLTSIECLGAKVVVGDLGSRDSTIRRCKGFKCEIIHLQTNDDLSRARNSMLLETNTIWHMMLEPWEELMEGSAERVRDAMLRPPQAYKINVMQSDILTKETRLWHSSLPLRFENPVFENIRCDAKHLDMYVLSRGGKRDIDYGEIISKWMSKCPLSPEPLYYKASHELVNKNWESYLNHSELFLHQQKKQDMSFFMTNYYRAMVLCYIKKDYNGAARALMACILKKPAMAEFWCLLGDIFYATHEYDKASCFYENAKIAGSRRLKSCEFPMEVSKYKEYPDRMIEACRKLKSSMNFYGSHSKDDV